MQLHLTPKDMPHARNVVPLMLPSTFEQVKQGELKCCVARNKLSHLPILLFRRIMPPTLIADEDIAAALAAMAQVSQKAASDPHTCDPTSVSS